MKHSRITLLYYDIFKLKLTKEIIFFQNKEPRKRERKEKKKL